MPVGMFSSSNILTSVSVIQVLDQRAQAIAMGDHEEFFAPTLNHRRDDLLPVGQHAGHRVLQALGQRLFGRQSGRIALVTAGLARIPQVPTAAAVSRSFDARPDLLIAEFFGGFRLVQSLQRLVMAFIKTPGLVDRHPDQVHFFQDDP